MIRKASIAEQPGATIRGVRSHDFGESRLLGIHAFCQHPADRVAAGENAQKKAVFIGNKDSADFPFAHALAAMSYGRGRRKRQRIRISHDIGCSSRLTLLASRLQRSKDYGPIETGSVTVIRTFLCPGGIDPDQWPVRRGDLACSCGYKENNMSIGERVYLVIVIAGLLIFAVTLATVSWRTNRFMREQESAARQKAERPNLPKAA